MTKPQPTGSAGSGPQRKAEKRRPASEPNRDTTLWSVASLIEYFEQRQRLLACVLIVGTFTLFLPALRHDFINLDDPAYVTANKQVQGGLTWAGVHWAFGGIHLSNWHPLTWLSHMLDCELFGLHPWGHHLTSIGLHALNAVVLFLALRKLSGAPWPSLFAAALFAVHPLRIESVGWIAERKGLLSAFFGLIAIWAYAHWVRERETRPTLAKVRYGVICLAVALGLMCKQVLVSLPFVLLLLDYWPLNRFRASPDQSLRSVALRLVVEKLPLFALAASGSVIVYVAQQQGGAVHPMERLSLVTRWENVAVAYGRYLVKFVDPQALAVFYPFRESWPLPVVLGSVSLLVVLSVLVWLVRQRFPHLLVGWLWFIGTMIPMAGIIQVGGQSLADRYTYLPMIGLGLMIAWSLGNTPWAWWNRPVLSGALAGAVLLGCGVLTRQQIGFWRNSETLFRHALAVTQENQVAHAHFGAALAGSPGQSAEAITEFRAALAISPSDALTHYNLGIELEKMPGQMPDAIAEYEAALQTQPDDVDMHISLGNALAQTPGRTAAAITEYETALRLQPDSSRAHYNLANCLADDRARQSDAIAHYEAALRLDPGLADAHLNLGTVLAEIPDRVPEAIAHYRTAVQLSPDLALAHNDLGLALTSVPGGSAEAITEFEAAIRLQPNYVNARINLAVLLMRTPGREAEAIPHLEAAQKLQPGWALPRELLARLRPAGKWSSPANSSHSNKPGVPR